jgi:hypothetical protein
VRSVGATPGSITCCGYRIIVHVIANLIDIKRLEFYSTVDRYAVFIGLQAPVSPVATTVPGPSSSLQGHLPFR